MSIKGLKEALEKKQAQQHPELRTADAVAPTAVLIARPVRNKLLKKATGRGR